jgi:hypothetical protein
MATQAPVVFVLYCILGVNLLIMFPSLALGCTSCVHQSKLAYYAYQGAVDVGACGYGSFAETLYGGNVGGSSRDLYRNGVACGACYQMRCTDSKLCNKSGTTIVVTDFTESSQTDFVVTRSTFSSMALPDQGDQLLNAGIIDIEYKRVPCQYKDQNMSVKVDKLSRYPNYLAVQFLYQGGQTDIVSVDVEQVGSSEKHDLKRNYGAVWDIENPPEGPLQFGFVIFSGYNGKRVWPTKPVLPSDWKVGGVYDSGLQINDVSLEKCSQRHDNNGGWGDSAIP